MIGQISAQTSFELASNQLRASSKPAPNQLRASSEPANVMEFGLTGQNRQNVMQSVSSVQS